MFDGGNTNVTVDQRGGQTRVTDVIRTCMNIDRRIKVGATENNASVWRCGTQRHIHLVAGMQADASRTDDIFKRTLLDHLLGTYKGQQPIRAGMLTQS